MAGALLRSGKLESYKALGDDGRPVYRSALQLREAVRLKLGKDVANCLAIPQQNDTGDNIDWYAAEGDEVIPWSTATDDERQQAIKDLEFLQQSLQGEAEKMSRSENREQKIFGRLLDKVIFFPDSQHVYLVNDKPVITFWGFTGADGVIPANPLACLSAMGPRPTAPVTEPVLETPLPVPVPTKKRFPWWWILLALLLLLALLFLWRSCAEPEVIAPPLPEAVTDEPVPEQQDPELRRRTLVDDVDRLNGVNPGLDTVNDVDSAEPLTETETPADEMPVDPAQNPEEPPLEDPASEEPPLEEPPSPEETPADEQGPLPLPEEPPVPEPQSGEPLQLGAEQLQDEKASFLNGSWNAGAGIQDAETGRPLQLEYDFSDGQGKVKVKDAQGVDCVGNVSTRASGGSLSIASEGAVKCPNGATYRLPNIECKPGATSKADCSGSYDGENAFPMSIKRQ
nr:SrfA family protein [Ketobacter sp.]